MVKKYKNLEKSKKISKDPQKIKNNQKIQKTEKNQEKNIRWEKKRYPLSFLILGGAIRPKLSNPVRFRLQRDGEWGRTNERKSSSLI